jgi:hypothetical protein
MPRSLPLAAPLLLCALSTLAHPHWDLSARHLLVWYPLPQEEPWQRIVGSLLAQRLSFRFAQHKDGPLANRRAFSTVERLTPRGGFKGREGAGRGAKGRPMEPEGNSGARTRDDGRLPPARRQGPEPLCFPCALGASWH